MVAIGSFQFPKEKTFYEVRMIEAKSKVRKEIQITSLIEHTNTELFQECLLKLQSSVEAFDQRQAKLILNDGRYAEGRRRLLEVLPDGQHQLAFIKLIVFTHDRYERSLTHHQLEQDIFLGTLTVSVWNQGNWFAEPTITIIPDEDAQEISIQGEESAFLLQYDMSADQVVVIDSTERCVSVDGQRISLPPNLSFPTLVPKRNSLQFDCLPNNVNASVKIQHRDIWV